jgi:hypothetical protein
MFTVADAVVLRPLPYPEPHRLVRVDETLRTPIVRGRAFAASDGTGAQTVAVVNEAFVRRYFPGDDPLGRRIGFGDQGAPGYWRTLVGVAADVRQEALSRPADPQVFIPFQQDREPWFFAGFLLRTSGNPLRLERAVRTAVLEVDPGQPVARIQTLEQAMTGSLAGRRLTLWLVALFAGVAWRVATYVRGFRLSPARREKGRPVLHSRSLICDGFNVPRRSARSFMP